MTKHRWISVILLTAQTTLFARTLSATVPAWAQSPTEYRLSFPDATHHVMQVDATFRLRSGRPLRLKMARSSPGRYGVFEFAKNVFLVRVTDSNGKPLRLAFVNPRRWEVAGHNGSIRLTYQVFGDRLDGTFLSIDITHAHLNFPALLIWAEGLENDGITVTFVPPAGSQWQAATQLYPTPDPLTFTAPNLPYLMDSPAELSAFVLRSFAVAPLQPGGRVETIRIALHHTGDDAQVDEYVSNLRKLVLEEQAVFGELPEFDPGYFTLLADFLPWGNFDGMEHRNSAVLTSQGTLANNPLGMLSNAAHEFFHVWNIKRIRPRTLEPFDFDDANASAELWLGEGFTNYYERLTMIRCGFKQPAAAIGQLGGEVNYVLSAPGGHLRSPAENSLLAPLTDTGGASSPDPTYWQNSFVNYYSYGDAIALGLDLTLRARSDSRVSLDDFMRAMWHVHGKPSGTMPGAVPKPYSMADVMARLAEVSGDKQFAEDFVRRHITGTEHVDYGPLLLRAGFVLRKKNPGKATLGAIQLEKKSKGAPLQVVSPTIVGSPAYKAGLDLDDELISIAGATLVVPGDLANALASHNPDEDVEIVFKRRGREVKAIARLAEDEQVEIAPLESTGVPLTGEQAQFRARWLRSKEQR